MTPEQLDAIEKLAEAATPGPYQVASVYPAYGVFRVEVGEPSECIAMCAVSVNEDADEPHVERQAAHERNAANARAIAALLKYALPLVKAVREARTGIHEACGNRHPEGGACVLETCRLVITRTKQRDKARAEVERLRAAITRFVDQYPWQQGPEVQELKALAEGKQ